MTGRELVIYILENGLENEEILDKEGKPAGMMTPEECAEKFGVPIATLMAWLGTGKVMSFLIGDTHYIPRNAENPNKWMTQTRQRVKGPTMNIQPTPISPLVGAVEEMNNAIQ